MQIFRSFGRSLLRNRYRNCWYFVADMKLYFDAGNQHALKAVIAADVAKIQLELQEVKSTDSVVPYLKKNKLPVLETKPGDFIFSSNAICRYLLEKGNVDLAASQVDEWLEWESSRLQPALAPYLVAKYGSPSKPDPTALTSLLGHLDKALQGKSCLVQDSLTAADIVLWSALYPAFFPGSPPLGSQLTSILSWFTSLSQVPQFQRAVATVTRERGIDGCKVSILAQPLPLSPLPAAAPAASSRPASGPAKVKEESDCGEDLSMAEVVTSEEIAEAYRSWLDGKAAVPIPHTPQHPILPVKDKKNVLVTSALPYVNNVPHLGNIIGSLLSADVFARFCRLRNWNTLYICGTDEYGTATETKAMEEGVTPQQICDKYHKLHAEIYDWFNLKFDYFGRTTTQRQTEIAQDIFWRLYRNGYCLKDTVEQLQCQTCNMFLADRFVEGTCPLCNYEGARGDQCDKCGKLINATELKMPKCKVCNNTPVLKTSEHLFLDLPKVEPLLQQYLDKVLAEGMWADNAKNITQAWLRDGLKPRCITRDLKWGTQVPLEGFTDKVFYVWFDAPIGYLSITANYTDQWEKWWKNPKEVELYQFMAKDNVPFHSVVFPSTQLGATDNYTIVDHLMSTEYLNYEDGKFSKSRGVGVFGNHARDTGIPADVYRFYLLYLRPENQDSVFSWTDLATKNNTELLNNLGNFINRALMFLEKNFNGTVPQMDLDKSDKQLLAQVTKELRRYIDNVHRAKLRSGLVFILNISRIGNQYIQFNEPWKLIKGNEKDKARAGTVIGLCTNLSCLLSTMMEPYMPQTSQTVQQQLQAPSDCNVITENFVCHLPPGHRIGKPQPLFQKIEMEKVEEMKKRFAGKQKESDDAVAASNNVKAQKSKSSSKPPPQPAPASSTVDNTPPPPAASKEEVEKITAEVTRQGEVVRKAKADKADKAVVGQEVEKLLVLKRQLAVASGQDPSVFDQKGKKKGGKK